MQQTAIENFIARINELSSHIDRNKDILKQKRAELEALRNRKDREKKVLQLKVLELSRKKLYNTKLSYDELQYAYEERVMREECERLKGRVSAKKLLFQRLETKCDEMERRVKEEKEKWNTTIEKRVRDEAAQASMELKGLVFHSVIQEKTRELQEKEKRICSLQEDLDMLVLEKVEQQEEYKRCTEEWKAKQNRVMELNQLQISLNQEYNQFRQQYVKNQKERNERRDEAMRKQVASIEKRGFRTAALIMQESSQW